MAACQEERTEVWAKEPPAIDSVNRDAELIYLMELGLTPDQAYHQLDSMQADTVLRK